MKVALFSSTAKPVDGYGTITVELSKALMNAGIDVTLFLPTSQKEAATLLRVKTSCVLPEYIYRVFQPKALGYLQTVDLKGFDLAHDLFAFPHGIIALRSAKKAGIPFVIGAQGTHGVRPLSYIPEKWILKHCYKNASRIAVPSAFTRDLIHKLSGEQYPIDVIHNGVDFARFQKSVDHETVRKNYAGKKILLTVGGLWGRKGQDLVIRALPEILKKHPDAVYCIVGKGSTQPELERLADELGVRSSVDFAGPKSGDDLVSYFKACDVYVHTPRVTGLKFEGFGIVYIEAGACGKPSVATDAGGIRDAVLDGKTGLVVPDGDIAGIAGAVSDLLSDDTKRKHMGEEAHAYAKNHDWSVIAAKFIDLYTNAISRR